MVAVKVGCCGFPVGRAEYFRRFPVVEINSSFYNLPKPETARRWREEAPAGFEYSLKAWQLITHPHSSPTYGKLRAALGPKGLARCGHFQASDEVTAAWARTSEIVEALQARFVLFQTPAGFYPNANHLRDMYRFFKAIRRPPALLAWEPRGEWEDSLIKRVCADLGLIHAVDPTMRESQRGSVRYWRLHGRLERGRVHYQHQFSEAELSSLAARLPGLTPVYAFFNNSSMWNDARRFLEIFEPAPRPARRALL